MASVAARLRLNGRLLLASFVLALALHAHAQEPGPRRVVSVIPATTE
jgi:hypothetical protein